MYSTGEHKWLLKHNVLCDVKDVKRERDRQYLIFYQYLQLKRSTQTLQGLLVYRKLQWQLHTDLRDRCSALLWTYTAPCASAYNGSIRQCAVGHCCVCLSAHKHGHKTPNVPHLGLKCCQTYIYTIWDSLP